MTKLIYFTDPHVSGKTPISRLDNYPETILNKVRQVGEIARDVGADAVLCGGDWFERPDVGPNIVAQLGEILRQFPCKIYTVLGNHDVYGYNAATASRSMIGILSGFGAIVRLKDQAPEIIGNFAVSGVDASYQLDRAGRISDYTDGPVIDGKINLRVLHSFLDTNKWPEEVASTCIYDLPETRSNIILTGHEHTGYGHIKHRNTSYVNPGALGRVTASVGDVNRVVRVCIIESSFSPQYEISFRELDYAPADEVLDRERLKREKEAVQNREKFLATLSGSSVLKEMGAVETFNIYSALAKLSAEDGISEQVVDVVRNILAAAEEEIGKSRIGDDDE